MEVRLDDVLDAEPVLARLVQIKLHVALGIEHCRNPLRPDHVRCVSQATQVELFEIHGVLESIGRFMIVCNRLG
jgi:hypothetical protein